jgi:hypothetical protein
MLKVCQRVAHAFNPSTWEAEAGGFLSSGPARAIEKPCLEKTKKKQKKTKKPKNQKKKKKKKSLPPGAGGMVNTTQHTTVGKNTCCSCRGPGLFPSTHMVVHNHP